MNEKMTKEEFLLSIDEFLSVIKNEEKAENTVTMYKIGIIKFINYADNHWYGKSTFKDGIIEYKKYLQQTYKLTTANLYLIALNKYLKYINREDMCVKTFKIQEKNSLELVLTMADYNKMAEIAKTKNPDTYYLMLIIASTGVRVDELQFITVETLKRRECAILNKGKSRNIVIADDICLKLLEYCKQKNITNGYVFYARNPKKYTCESTVLRRLKKIAELANIDKEKVSSRNLRHLFAKRFMEVIGNVSLLKFTLGHSSLKTTMIYICPTNDEKRQEISKLGF